MGQEMEDSLAVSVCLCNAVKSISNYCYKLEVDGEELSGGVAAQDTHAPSLLTACLVFNQASAAAHLMAAGAGLSSRVP